MMHTEPIHPNLANYALGLLNNDERKAIEQHTANCPACQQQLQSELAIGKLVQATLQTATHVDNGRLRHLMPALPSKRHAPRWTSSLIQRQFAPVIIFLVLFIGTVGLYQTTINQSDHALFPTSLAATATNIHPTATAVATQAAQEIPETAVVTMLEQEIVPIPAATPIAFVLNN